MTNHADVALVDVQAAWTWLVGQHSLGFSSLTCKCKYEQCQHPVISHSCHVDMLTDQTDRFCTHPDLCTAGSSEVHELTCQPTGQSPEELSAHHGSDLWTGSGLARPEAILTLPPDGLSASPSETCQPILMLLVQHQAGMAAWGQAWKMLGS